MALNDSAGLIECTLGLKMPMAHIFSNFIHGLGLLYIHQTLNFLFHVHSIKVVTYKLTLRDNWNGILGFLYSLYVKICSTYNPTKHSTFFSMSKSIGLVNPIKGLSYCEIKS